MKNKIVFHNPFFESWYGENLYFFITRRKSNKKYSYVLEYIIKDYKENVYIFLDLKQNSFSSRFNFLNGNKTKKFVTYIEFGLWCLINKVNIFKLKIKTELTCFSSEDKLITFSFMNLDNDIGLSYINETKIKKIFLLSHYMLDTEKVSNNAKNLNANLFVAENNLSKNSDFFNKYFDWYQKDVYLLPFVFKNRFQKYISFDQRKNICLATGTYQILYENDRTKDFINYFKTDTYHPMRKYIYQNQEKLKGYIDSFISNYDEVASKKISGNYFNKLIAILYNTFFVKQKNYYKFNIVDKYNEYKMFVVPEEINDLPGIGFVEGMACCSAFIGLNKPYYRDIGLVPNIHYITYDGTPEDLIEKIKYYQEHSEELEKIALAGYEYVTNTFNEKKVASIFYNDLTENNSSIFVSK